MGKGLFVVLEGIDGSGTTTNAKMLVGWLEERGVKAWFTSEPTKGPIGIIARRKLREKGFKDPVFETLLFAADRAWHLREEILPKLSEGYVVICDRYYESSIAYQGAQGLDIEWIIKVNSMFPEPDLTILLDLEPREAVGRIDSRVIKERFENVEFLGKVRSLYLQRAKERGYRILDASRSLDLVQGEIRKIVLENL